MAGSFSLSRASEGIRSRVFPSSEKARARLRERDEREMVGCEGSRRDNGAVLRGLFPPSPRESPIPPKRGSLLLGCAAFILVPQDLSLGRMSRDVISSTGTILAARRSLRTTEMRARRTNLIFFYALLESCVSRVRARARMRINNNRTWTRGVSSYDKI